MASIQNPRKTYRFRVSITDPNGTLWNQFEIEEFDPPTSKIEVATHGAGNYQSKTPGQETVDTIKIKKLKDGASDTKMFNWWKATKTKGNRVDYAKTIVVEELDAAEDLSVANVLNTYYYYECFPTSYKPGAWKRTDTAVNQMEELEFSVDTWEVQ